MHLYTVVWLSSGNVFVDGVYGLYSFIQCVHTRTHFHTYNIQVQIDTHVCTRYAITCTHVHTCYTLTHGHPHTHPGYTQVYIRKHRCNIVQAHTIYACTHALTHIDTHTRTHTHTHTNTHTQTHTQYTYCNANTMHTHKHKFIHISQIKCLKGAHSRTCTCTYTCKCTSTHGMHAYRVYTCTHIYTYGNHLACSVCRDGCHGYKVSS